MKHIFKRVVVLLNELDNIDRVLEKAIKFSDTHNSIYFLINSTTSSNGNLCCVGCSFTLYPNATNTET